MVEIKGGPFGGHPAEEIRTRQGAATSNYEANLQEISARSVAENININLSKLEEEIKKKPRQ